MTNPKSVPVPTSMPVDSYTHHTRIGTATAPIPISATLFMTYPLRRGHPWHGVMRFDRCQRVRRIERVLEILISSTTFLQLRKGAGIGRVSWLSHMGKG